MIFEITACGLAKKGIEYEEKVLIFQVTGIAVLLVFYGCYFIKMIAQNGSDRIGDKWHLLVQQESCFFRV